MRKLILSLMVLAIVAAENAAAQPQRTTRTDLTTAKQTRAVKIYLYKQANENKPEIPGRIVPVMRRIFDYEPLHWTLAVLMEGATEAERDRGIVDANLGNAEFVAARIKNQTAEINFKYDFARDKSRLWEEDVSYTDLAETIEKTARQFAGVKRVIICVNGIENYTNTNRLTQTKCPFEMFPPPPPRPLEPNEMWMVDVYLNHPDSPVVPWGARLALPVKRRVKAADFLSETFNAFMAGETKAERERGWSSATYGMKLVSVRLKNKKASIRFTKPPGVEFPDHFAPRVFDYAVADTALQFPGEVEEIEVCLDGVKNFYEENVAPIPCENE